MKINIVSIPVEKFHPVKIEITCETKEELQVVNNFSYIQAPKPFVTYPKIDYAGQILKELFDGLYLQTKYLL